MLIQAVRNAVIAYFTAHARKLPWRQPGESAWAVMVSEFMLQQTPVSRVLEPFDAWLRRWPNASALAAEPSSAAVAAWGRLGYPRRALRLHASAVRIVETHQGQVPEKLEVLRALPGVGSYTASAIASFAYGQSHVVLDTNVRRLLARVETASEYPPASPTRAETIRAREWIVDADAPFDGPSPLPAQQPSIAAVWAAASMELGALICTARNPSCKQCPITEHCSWFKAGRPPSPVPRRTQAWAGTDRQCRGRLLDLARMNPEGIAVDEALAHWHDQTQATRALASLVADGLAQINGDRLSL